MKPIKTAAAKRAAPVKPAGRRKADVVDIDEKEGGVASVNRALSILMAFESGIDGMTLAELTQATGLYHSTILRLCESLEQFRFIKRLADGRYVLGPMPFHLGMVYQGSFRLQDHALPVLRDLTRRTLETSAIYVREQQDRVCLHRVELPRTVRMNVREGERVELHKGAAGKVLLAWADDAMRLGGAEADHIRQSHYSISLAERESETAAIAAPVFGIGQKIVCAVSVGIPLYRFDSAAFTRSLPCVMEAAAKLTRDLGGDATAFAAPYEDPFVPTNPMAHARGLHG
jgi:DNA-binding IclR family transcriptional regulator